MTTSDALAFPLLSLDKQEFNKQPANAGALRLECDAYLRFIHKNKAFSVEKVEEDYMERYGVFMQEGAYTYTATTQSVPEHQPDALIARTDPRDVGQLRRMFANYATNVIECFGCKPQKAKNRFVLNYMLRGAMANYDDNKTLLQNATQFTDERKQKKLHAT